MAYFANNLGRFKGGVSKYTDRRGLVPQRGDAYKDSNFQGRLPCKWEEFVEEAEAVTEAVEKRMDEWRERTRTTT